jgi:hypothetical protein
LRRAGRPAWTIRVATVFAAEGSDWFWWYGDRSSDIYGAEFDAGFRDKLRGAYAAGGTSRAHRTRRADIRKGPVKGHTRPAGPFAPSWTADVGDYFEWRTAGHVAVRVRMRCTRRFRLARDLYFGTDGPAPSTSGSIPSSRCPLGTTIAVRTPMRVRP